LLEPLDSSSTIAGFLEKRGEGLHHLAFTVKDIQARIAELKQSGLRMIDEVPRPGAHHMQIAFSNPNTLSLRLSFAFLRRRWVVLHVHGPSEILIAVDP
jgi:methylmalonyl-CoA epimerase